MIFKIKMHKKIMQSLNNKLYTYILLNRKEQLLCFEKVAAA